MRRDVLLLASAYFCMNTVFYVCAVAVHLPVEARLHAAESGFLCCRCDRRGDVRNRWPDLRCLVTGSAGAVAIPAMTGLLAVAALLLAGVNAVNPYVAVGLLSLCFGFTQFTEGSFASGATYVGGPHASTAYGVVNTGGNAAGFLAPAVGLMVDHAGWLGPASGSAFAVLAPGCGCSSTSSAGHTRRGQGHDDSPRSVRRQVSIRDFPTDVRSAARRRRTSPRRN
jgi:hypothetical protein